MGEFRVRSKVSVRSSACRGAVDGWLRPACPRQNEMARQRSIGAAFEGEFCNVTRGSVGKDVVRDV